MDVVGNDLADVVVPVGLGVGSSQAQTARLVQGTPRTPTRSRGQRVATPQTPINLNEMDLEEDGGGAQDQEEEEMQAPAVTDLRAAGGEQEQEEIDVLQQAEVEFLADTLGTPESYRAFTDDDV